MAMPFTYEEVIYLRKSHYIKNPNHKDADFLNALRCSSVCTKLHAEKFKISTNRLKNYLLDKIIDKCHYIDTNGKNQEIFRISDSGKAWIRQNIPELADRKFYASTGIEHDLRIMDKIISLSPQQRANMRCEAEIRDEFKAMLDKLLEDREFERYNTLYEAIQNREISIPDLAYDVDQYFECVTSNYSQEMVQAKMEFSNAVNGNIEFCRI